MIGLYLFLAWWGPAFIVFLCRYRPTAESKAFTVGDLMTCGLFGLFGWGAMAVVAVDLLYKPIGKLMKIELWKVRTK